MDTREFYKHIECGTVKSLHNIQIIQRNSGGRKEGSRSKPAWEYTVIASIICFNHFLADVSIPNRMFRIKHAILNECIRQEVIKQVFEAIRAPSQAGAN
jgi:hypothetical protein